MKAALFIPIAALLGLLAGLMHVWWKEQPDTQSALWAEVIVWVFDCALLGTAVVVLRFLLF